MYVGYFERILRAAIVAEGGPEDWALPYWNYSASAEQALLPTPFRQETLEDGSPNPLFVAERNPLANVGEVFLEPRDVALGALEVPNFYVAVGETGTSFAGPETPFVHFGPGSGALESLPHNVVHVEVGLPDGWMIDPNMAALDPIFWLHHSNIDRLWDVWLQDPAHANTDVAGWATDVEFAFHDEAGVPQRLSSGAVTDAASSIFEYTYDDLSPAVAPSPLIAAAARISVQKPKATLAAATSQATPLSQQPVAVSVPRAAPPPRFMLWHSLAPAHTMPGHHAMHGHHGAHAASSATTEVSHWMLMVIAMMLPLLGPTLAEVRRTTYPRAHAATVGGYVLGWLLPWLLLAARVRRLRIGRLPSPTDSSALRSRAPLAELVDTSGRPMLAF